MTDRCSFCSRADLPLVRAKHAATCLECARLAMALRLRPVVRGGGDGVMVGDCDAKTPTRQGFRENRTQ
jgi:hypothetical protein